MGKFIDQVTVIDTPFLNDVDDHLVDTGNPHSVTAVQAGADPAGSASAVQTNLDTHKGAAQDDHTIYALADGSRGSFATVAQGGLADSALQSGDAVSVLTNDAGYVTAPGLTYNGRTSAFNAVADNAYLIDGSSAAVDGTLPASPSLGDIIAVKAVDITNTVRMLRNGNNIAGLAQDLTIDKQWFQFEMVWIGGTIGWTV